VRFEVGEGGIRMRAEVPPSPKLLTALRQYRDVILALLDHDAGEAAAMAEHYAAPAAAPGDYADWSRPEGIDGPDLLTDGLLQGFAHSRLLTEDWPFLIRA
jgi:hypothetical protein